MKFLKTSPVQIQLLKASLLALAAIGVVFPSMSSAQQSIDTSASNSLGNHTVLADGMYLFGQSPSPNVEGSAYAVFSVKDNQTIGAFYAPNSSFDCFSGTISPHQLSVEVVESYTQQAYPYKVAVMADDSLVAGTGAGAYTLEGFHRINTLSAKDHEILAVCQADLS